MTVNQIVTKKIIDRLAEAEKTGENFYWVCPFSEGRPKSAVSFDTLQEYRGINHILLRPDEYLTFNMVQNLNKKMPGDNYHIRKGAKSEMVVFYSTRPIVDERGETKTDEDGKPIERGFLRYYNVFSRCDIVTESGDNLPSKLPYKHYSHEEITEQTRKGLDRFNRMMNSYFDQSGIEVQVVKDSPRAYFSHDMTIRIPAMENFKSVYEYVSTVAHEAAHSTGMLLGRFDHYNGLTEQYSREELTAEIAAAIVVQELGILDDRENRENTLAYLQGWASYLKDRPNELVGAAARAEKAAELILSYEKEHFISAEAEQNFEVGDEER